MSAVPNISPVSWTDSAVDPAAPSSADSSVRSWLNQQGVQDITQLSPKDLQALIAFLQQNATAPGVNTLLAKLTELQTNWTASTSGQDKLSNAINDLKFKDQFLSTLANTTTGNDGLDTAKSNIDGALSSLEGVQKSILEGSISIDQDSGPSTEKAVTGMLEKLDSLKNSGADLNALGLQGMYDSLKTALDSYHSGVESSGDDSTKLDMVGSQFRKDVAGARKDYLVSTGLSENHGLVQKEQDVIDGEDTYQDYLRTPKDENWRPDTPGTTVKDIKNAYKEAERMYKDAESSGDQDSMNFFRERMNVLRTGIEQLESGKENPLIVIVTMYVSLLNLDTVRLETLRVRALDSNNQSLADRISERIDTIGQLIQEINKGQMKLLSGVENILNSVR
jgi:hypothetical protein